MKRTDVAVLIPAINEELVIALTLESVLKLVDKEHIYLVNDGSTDKTEEIAKQYINNVLTLPNGGKAKALNTSIEYFNLPGKYEYLFFMDADTQPNEEFLDVTMRHFDKDYDKKVVCVVGRVHGLGGTWISKYRKWEYFVAHAIHKRAQSFLRSILVVPGCATVYRSFVFREIQFPRGTLAEDMDFTFLLHRRGHTNMIYEDAAVVYTQDPQTLVGFVKQINRWYTGFWQCVRKHQLPWKGQPLDFEVALLGIEGLYNGLLISMFFLGLPYLYLTGILHFFSKPLLLDFGVFFFPTVLLSAIKNRDLSLFFYIPHFYFMRFLSCLVFLKSFFGGFMSEEKEYSWDTKRYVIK